MSAQELTPEGVAELGDYVAALDAADRWAAGSLAGDVVVGEGAAVVADLPEHPLGALAVAWSPGGDRLVVGGQDGLARWWSPSEGAGPALRLGDWVARVAWSPSGDEVALAAGRTVVVTDRDGAERRRHVLPATATDLVWTAAGDQLVVAAYGGAWWFGRDQVGPARVLERTGALLCLALSPDERWLAAGQQEKVVCLWDLSTGEDRQTTGYDLKVEHLAWDASSRYLAVGQYGELSVWDFSADHRSAPPRHLIGHTHRVTAIEAHPSGLLSSGAADGSVCVWALDEASPLVHAAHVGEEVSALAWSSTGAALYIGTAEGRVLRLALPAAGEAP